MKSDFREIAIGISGDLMTLPLVRRPAASLYCRLTKDKGLWVFDDLRLNALMGGPKTRLVLGETYKVHANRMIAADPRNADGIFDDARTVLAYPGMDRAAVDVIVQHAVSSRSPRAADAVVLAAADGGKLPDDVSRKLTAAWSEVQDFADGDPNQKVARLVAGLYPSMLRSSSTNMLISLARKALNPPKNAGPMPGFAALREGLEIASGCSDPRLGLNYNDVPQLLRQTWRSVATRQARTDLGGVMSGLGQSVLRNPTLGEEAHWFIFNHADRYAESMGDKATLGLAQLAGRVTPGSTAERKILSLWESHAREEIRAKELEGEMTIARQAHVIARENPESGLPAIAGRLTSLTYHPPSPFPNGPNCKGYFLRPAP